MQKNEVIEMVGSAGLNIKNSRRLPDDRGDQLITYEGPILNCYDTGVVVVGGRNVENFRQRLVALGRDKDVIFCPRIGNTKRVTVSLTVKGETELRRVRQLLNHLGLRARVTKLP
jgi:hypothetical protein